MNDQAQILYIVGAGRSGSTLLDMVLGSHPDTFSLGEVVHLPTRWAMDGLCSCRNPIRSCSFWSLVMHRMSEEMGVDLEYEPSRLDLHIAGSKGGLYGRVVSSVRLGAALALGLSRLEKTGLPLVSDPRAIETTLQLFEVVQSVSKCSFLVDSVKSARRVQILHYQRPSPTYRVIYLVRDGRAVIHSMLKPTYTVEMHERGEDGKLTVIKKTYPAPRTYTFPEATRVWLLTNLYAMLVLHTLPKDRCLSLRYEDFCIYPEKQLKRICNFMEIDFHESMLDFRSVVHHTIPGNAICLQSGGLRLPTSRWRTAFSTSELRRFDRIAGWLNRHFGYA